MDVTIPCVCPPDGTRHPDGDTVTLRETLGFVATQAARNAVSLHRASGEADAASVLAVLTEQYIFLGVESWSVCDEKGKPLPVNRANLRERLMENPDADDAATLVADAADDLYSKKVMLPLIRAASKSSPDTQTPRTTSPTNGSDPSPDRPSSPSSISTIPTAATGTTSKRRGGASSSSRSSASAA